MLTLNYGNLVSKIKKILESWHNHDLTIMGKITIVNTLVVSQMVYRFLNTYSPNVFYTNTLEKLIKKYLWYDKPARIKFEVLKQDCGKGGLQLTDITKKNISLKYKQLINILAENNVSVYYAQKILPMPTLLIANCNICTKDVRIL